MTVTAVRLLSEAHPAPARCDAAPKPDAEEMAWVARARTGDTAAFGWLLARYRDRAVRLAAHVLRRPEEAEDVAQEAFITAFQSIGSFRGEGRFYTWLYRIVVRNCLERKRRRSWHAEEPGRCSAELAGNSAPSNADARLLVEMLLDHLTPVLRAALVLRELEGLEYEEIAAVLRVPVGTVRSRLNAARARFRMLCEEVDSETDAVPNA